MEWNEWLNYSVICNGHINEVTFYNLVSPLSQKSEDISNIQNFLKFLTDMSQFVLFIIFRNFEHDPVFIRIFILHIIKILPQNQNAEMKTEKETEHHIEFMNSNSYRRELMFSHSIFDSGPNLLHKPYVHR